MEERRCNDNRLIAIEKELSLLRNDFNYIKSFIEEDRVKMKDHIESSSKYREWVLELKKFPEAIQDVKSALKDHVCVDKWIYGTIFLTQLGIIIKLFS